MESAQISLTWRSSASSWSRDFPGTSPASVTPSSRTPPRAFANAAISSAQLSRWRRPGSLERESTRLNSQSAVFAEAKLAPDLVVGVHHCHRALVSGHVGMFHATQRLLRQPPSGMPRTAQSRGRSIFQRLTRLHRCRPSIDVYSRRSRSFTTSVGDGGRTCATTGTSAVPRSIGRC